MKSIFLAIALLAAVPGWSQQQDRMRQTPQQGGQSTISGKVKDELSGSFVEYSTISLFKQSDSSLVTGTITQPDGSFALEGLTHGMYFLEASFVGYKPTRVTRIGLNPQRPSADVGILLLEPATTALDAAEVVGTRSVVEYRIDKRVIQVDQTIVASGGTAVDVLENTPSVQVDVEGNVSLRGSSNFTVLIDGRPSVLQGSEALQQLPASIIQSIEIITNPSAKYDPAGSAGIINIVMKKQRQSGVNGIINPSVSSNGSFGGDFLINMRQQKVNYFVGGSYNERKFRNKMFMELEKYRNDTVDYEIVNASNIFQRNGKEIRGGVELFLNEKSTLSLSGSLNQRIFGRGGTGHNRIYSGPSAGMDNYYTEFSAFSNTRDFFQFNLDYQYKFNENGHQLNTSAVYSDQLFTQLNELRQDTTDVNRLVTGLLPYRQQSLDPGNRNELRIRVDYTFPMRENTKLEAGYQYNADLQSSDYRFETFVHQEQIWMENPLMRNGIGFSNTFHSLYTTYGGSLFSWFDFQTGLRLEYNYRLLEQKNLMKEFPFEKIDLFPSLHLSKKLPYKLQAQASFSRRVDRPNQRALNPQEFYMNPRNIRVGNPALRPAYVNSYEINFIKELKGPGFVSAELFHRKTTDMISQIRLLRDDNLMANSFANINNDFSTGVEIMTNLPLAQWWLLNASASMFEYRIEGTVETEDATNQTFSWNSRLNSTFRLKYIGQLQITGFYNAPSISPQGTRDRFFTSSIALRQEFFKRSLTVSLQASDLLGTTKFRFSSSASNFSSFNQFTPQARVVRLSLTYRINNYNQRARRTNNQGEVNESEFDGGMDTM